MDGSSKYETFGSLWKAAFDFLKQCRKNCPCPGRYGILDNQAYALIQEYSTSPSEERRWEAHRKFIDIQFVLEGNECIGYAPVDQMMGSFEYDEEKDCILGEWVKEETKLYLHSGTFAVFFPRDAHRPGCLVKESEQVRKIVVKLPVSEFKGLCLRC